MPLLGAQALRVVLILLLAWLLHAVAARLIRLFRSYMGRRTGPDEITRVETLARVFRHAASIIIFIVAGTLVLDSLGISVAPILATAGVAGVAIGFGAQSLIKDYFTGFFVLLEDQIRQGDVIEVAGKSGLVEELTLRYVRLRDFDGHVHFVPNGEIKVVSNRTRGFAHAAIEVGVERLDHSAVVLRCRLKVAPATEQWNVKREFLRRLKLAFDQRGIERPFPQLAVHIARDAA